MNDFFSFYCNLDRENDKKLAKKLFLKKKIHYSWFSLVRPENSSNSTSYAEIEGHRERLGSQEKKLKEAAKREKYEKYERMK